MKYYTDQDLQSIINEMQEKNESIKSENYCHMLDRVTDHVTDHSREYLDPLCIKRDFEFVLSNYANQNLAVEDEMNGVTVIDNEIMETSMEEFQALWKDVQYALFRNIFKEALEKVQTKDYEVRCSSAGNLYFANEDTMCSIVTAKQLGLALEEFEEMFKRFKENEMRPYKIPVSLTMTGEYEVYAKNLKEAIVIAYGRELPEFQHYLEDSFRVDVGQIPINNKEVLAESEIEWALSHEDSYADQILQSANNRE